MHRDRQEFEINGHKIKSVHYRKPTKAQLKTIKHIRAQFYVSDKEAMRANLKKVLLEGSSQVGDIYAYYFERIANDAKRFDTKATINEVLAHDDCLTAYLNHVESYTKFYKNPCVVKNVKQAFRAGGVSGIAKKLANFPLNAASALLTKYSLGADDHAPIYVDTSCGWGVRMLAAAANGHDYVGFDVNPRLVKKLRSLAKEIKRILPYWNCQINEQGSEHNHYPLEDRAAFMLTSPPYFCLEDYRYGDQSYKSGMSYKKWCRTYLKNMLINSHKYLRVGGYCLINIKDFKEFDLVAKTRKYGRLAGLKFCGYDTLKFNAKASRSNGNVDMAEPVLVFQKR